MVKQSPSPLTGQLVEPFPMPGRLVALAYRELHLAETGTDEDRAALGTLSRLPRPWIPASCQPTDLRAELWEWLEAVVTWFNHEYVFDPVDAIPACWPQHPHLVNEIAVLADQRRRAQYTYDSDALDQWHRVGLPAFLERLHHRLADHCTDGHPDPWPAAGRFSRYQTAGVTRSRVFERDLRNAPSRESSGHPREILVDADTGEVLECGDQTL